MTELEKCRQIIDEIDTKIIKLYEKRMEVVENVIKYKLENNIPVLDSNREDLMLKNNLEKIKNKRFKNYYKSVLSGFLTASKSLQDDIKTLNNK